MTRLPGGIFVTILDLIKRRNAHANPYAMLKADAADIVGREHQEGYGYPEAEYMIEPNGHDR